MVGGVEPPGDRPAVSIDLSASIGSSRWTRVTGGAHPGGRDRPSARGQLRGHGLTLRHFPQSFEFSTLGGWIATRAGGHYATLHTHIDDFVESLRASRRGAVGEPPPARLRRGASPDRMLLGSEGILGVITEAWMRVQDAPRFRASAAVRFDSFESGARPCARCPVRPPPVELPAARPGEAPSRGSAPDGKALLVLGFESADHSLGAWMARALELCADHGGRPCERAAGERGTRAGATERGASEGAWRDAFLQAPYLRDTLVAAGIVAETFETAITWDRFADLVDARPRGRARGARGEGAVTCRLTHVYPDGAAPYFTVLAPARRGQEFEQWAS